MKKLSLKTQLYNRLKSYGDWVPKWKIEERSKELGFLAENGCRRIRELVEEGLLEQKEEKGIAWYRHKKVRVTKTIYKIEGSRVISEQKTLFI